MARCLLVLGLPAVTCLGLAFAGGENGGLADMIPLVTFAGSLVAGLYCGWGLVIRGRDLTPGRALAGLAVGLLCTVASIAICFLGCSVGFEGRRL